VVPFSGSILGLSSDPALVGTPIELLAEGHGRHSLRVAATYDAARRVPVHTLEVNYLVPHELTLRFGSEGGLSLSASAGSTEWHGLLQLTGEELTGGLAVRQTPVTLALDRSGNAELTPLLQPTLDSIDTLEASLVLSGTLAKPRTQLRTSLGRQLT